jgi:hypothetical protein
LRLLRPAVWIWLLVFILFKEYQSIAQAVSYARGLRAELLEGKARAVDPQRAVAKPSGGKRVPAVGAHEEDLFGLQAGGIRAERVSIAGSPLLKIPVTMPRAFKASSTSRFSGKALKWRYWFISVCTAESVF